MRAETRHALRYFVPAAIVSFVASPLTAVWAFVLGAAIAVVAAVAYLATRADSARVALLIALGVFAGALPYIVAGLVISAFD